MPIRTNRGRAAVYRRLWGWPMRSPAHLAGALLAFVVVVVVSGIVAPKLFGTAENDSRAVAPASNERSTPDSGSGDSGGLADQPDDAASPLPTRLTEPVAPPSPAEPDPEALAVAEKWAAAWVSHPAGISTEEWLEGLEPYTTKEFLPVMASVDPSNIPSSEVTGEAEAVSSFAKSLVALVPTNGPDLRITVVRTDYGWRVAHYEKAG